MLITCWYMVGLPFMGSVVCHTFPLFGKSTLGIISFDFLYDSFTRALPLLSFSVALPLLSFMVLSVFTLIPSTISRARHCSRQYADAVLTLLRSFIKRSGSAHMYIYIYIYIQTLAQNRTAVIKISCLATLGNKVVCTVNRTDMQMSRKHTLQLSEEFKCLPL